MMGRLGGRNKKSPERGLIIDYLAEKVGFEPTVMLPPRLISSLTIAKLAFDHHEGGSFAELL